MHRRRALTLRGLLCLLLGIAFTVTANLLGAPVFLAVAVLLLALPPLALLFVFVPRRSGQVSRQISTDLLTVGEMSQVRVRFDLRSPGIPFGIWSDELPDAVAGNATGTFPPPGGLDGFRYAITGVRRGAWKIGPLNLWTMDPFGLVQREQAFGETRSVTVVPAVVPLAALGPAFGASGGTAQTTSPRLGQGSDNLTPRRYVSGDSMRRIHWRATAHRGDLMVRQEEEESSPDAIVVLDRATAHWAAPTQNPDGDFEAAVSACASIAVHLAHEGYSVDVYDSTGDLLGSLRGEDEDRDELLISLALVRPQRESGTLAAIIGGTPPGPLVYITGSVDAGFTTTLTSHGATVPILLSTAPATGALDAAAQHGWHTGRLGPDIAAAWADALADREPAGGAHGTS